MFEAFRQSLRDLLDRGTPPEARREGFAQMKQSLVSARLGVDDLRAGVEQTRARLQRERTELETVRRRKGLAEGIADAETVRIAEQYEAQHAERAAVLERKLAAQEEELALTEREVAQMTTDLKRAMSGLPPEGDGPSIADRRSEAGAEVDAMLDGGARVADEIDSLGRASERQARESEADRLLAELKKRMGKA